MKLQRIKLGFTLIELLVVITIIGILATGAVSIYTSQIQKARDSVRLTDVKALQWGIEQFYQDDWTYPVSTTFSGVLAYVPNLPSDPKSGNTTASSTFEYLYNASEDANQIPLQEYEISNTFEQDGNMTWKAANVHDSWNDPFRLESWINVSDAGTDEKHPTASIGIATDALYICITPGSAAASGLCSTADGSTVNPMLIK